MKIPQIKGPLKNFSIILVVALSAGVLEHQNEVHSWPMLWHAISDGALHAVMMGFGWIAMQSNWTKDN